MKTGISLQSVIPVRAEPSHRAELVTQLLFGETYVLLDEQSEWRQVRLDLDHYEGWIHSSQSTPLSAEEYSRICSAGSETTLDLVQLLYNETANVIVPLLLGSSLPGLEDSRFRIAGSSYHYEGTLSPARLQGNAEKTTALSTDTRQLISDAMLYLHAPYLWGGRSPFGIDCSGFVQMVFKLQGISLPRDASQQATVGEPVSLNIEAEPGDLAFFDDSEGKITHVGMFIDKTRLIHCSGQVRIDPVDHLGIFHAGLGKYTHHLRLIKRIIS